MLQFEDVYADVSTCLFIHYSSKLSDEQRTLSLVHCSYQRHVHRTHRRSKTGTVRNKLCRLNRCSINTAACLKLHQVNYNLAAGCCQLRKGKRFREAIKATFWIKIQLQYTRICSKVQFAVKGSPTPKH